MSGFSFTFMRHALTDYNRQNRLTGREDVPLCDQGFQEINKNRTYILEAIAKADIILCSTLLRCRQTCEALGIKGTVLYSDALIEKDFGTATGKQRTELQRDKETGLVIGHEMESAENVRKRVVPAIRSESQKGKVFVISHGGVFTALNSACQTPLPEKPKNVTPYRFVNYGTPQSQCIPFN